MSSFGNLRPIKGREWVFMDTLTGRTVNFRNPFYTGGEKIKSLAKKIIRAANAKKIAERNDWYRDNVEVVPYKREIDHGDYLEDRGWSYTASLIFSEVDICILSRRGKTPKLALDNLLKAIKRLSRNAWPCDRLLPIRTAPGEFYDTINKKILHTAEFLDKDKCDTITIPPGDDRNVRNSLGETKRIPIIGGKPPNDHEDVIFFTDRSTKK